ncbi:leucocin A/sakacin P family class II bacteriocin [Ligilactobacillus faecis]|uniref:Leucocin A/sakacin P family class II bacteriocin n=1 Tax=Ligilactobacillus faecis TaxID=762833 RepID=A0ABV4DM81_9LACO
MKKLILLSMTVVAFIFVTGLNSNAYASTTAQVPSGYGRTKLPEKYYGNGVYCNSFTCRVNWKQGWQSVREISYRGWMNGLPKLGTGGAR